MKNKARNEQQQIRLREIGFLIKNLRFINGYTQAEFIKDTNIKVHINTLQNLESGKDVTLSVVLECIDSLGISVGEFFEGIN